MNNPTQDQLIEMLEALKSAQEKEQKIFRDMISIKDQIKEQLNMIIHKIETEL